jgi:hypothetical protein
MGIHSTCGRQEAPDQLHIIKNSKLSLQVSATREYRSIDVHSGHFSVTSKWNS